MTWVDGIPGSPAAFCYFLMDAAGVQWCVQSEGEKNWVKRLVESGFPAAVTLEVFMFCFINISSQVACENFRKVHWINEAPNPLNKFKRSNFPVACVSVSLKAPSTVCLPCVQCFLRFRSIFIEVTAKRPVSQIKRPPNMHLTKPEGSNFHPLH